MSVEPGPTAGPPARRLDPMAVAAVVLAAFALLQLRTSLKLVARDDADLVGEEYNVIYGLGRFLAEGVLYTDPGRPPFSAIQYGPAFFLAGKAAARVAGVRADDPAALASLLRGISLACLLGQAAAVGAILRRHLRASWSAVVAAGACVLVWQVPWSLAARPDSMESFLVIASAGLGFEAIRRGEGVGDRGRPTAWLAASLVVGTLAILAKQSGFVAGLVVLPPALVSLGWRRTAVACLAAGLVAAPMAAAFLLPCGPAIAANLIGSVKNGISLAAATHSAYAPYFRTMAAPAAAALVLGASSIAAARRPGRAAAAAAAGWGAIVAVATAAALALKYGSTINYFSTFNLFIPLAVAPALAEAGAGRLRGFVATFLILSIPAEVYADLNEAAAPRLPFAASAEVTPRLRALLDAAPPGTSFFSEDPRLNGLLPTRCVVPQAHLASVMRSSGAEDFADFARVARDGTIRYCVTFDPAPADLAESFRRFSSINGQAPDPDRPAFLGASFEGFRLLFRVGPYAVYESPHPRAE